VDYVAISVASRRHSFWSKGEVKNPETINYRTFKPEKGGLFCERIFGSVKDWECSCGSTSGSNTGAWFVTVAAWKSPSPGPAGADGHIDLAVPVSHIWFFKCMPSRIGLMLDMTARNLERVIYYEDYLVIDAGSTPLKQHAFERNGVSRGARDVWPEASRQDGSRGVRDALGTPSCRRPSRTAAAMTETRSKQIRKKLAKRIKLFQGFLTSKTRPEWMILTVLPVIPPDLRPLCRWRRAICHLRSE